MYEDIFDVLKKQKEKSGFFDLPKDVMCKDPSHNPPNMISIPYGQGYKHVCPSCGSVKLIINKLGC